MAFLDSVMAGNNNAVAMLTTAANHHPQQQQQHPASFTTTTTTTNQHSVTSVLDEALCALVNVLLELQKSSQPLGPHITFAQSTTTRVGSDGSISLVSVPLWEEANTASATATAATAAASSIACSSSDYDDASSSISSLSHDSHDGRMEDDLSYNRERHAKRSRKEESSSPQDEDPPFASPAPAIAPSSAAAAASCCASPNTAFFHRAFVLLSNSSLSNDLSSSSSSQQQQQYAQHSRLCQCTCLYNIALVIHLKATTSATCSSAQQRRTWLTEASVLYQEVFFNTLATASTTTTNTISPSTSTTTTTSLLPSPCDEEFFTHLHLSDATSSLLLATTLNIIACETALRSAASGSGGNTIMVDADDDAVLQGWKAVYTDLFVWATAAAAAPGWGHNHPPQSQQQQQSQSNHYDYLATLSHAAVIDMENDISSWQHDSDDTDDSDVDDSDSDIDSDDSENSSMLLDEEDEAFMRHAVREGNAMIRWGGGDPGHRQNNHHANNNNSVYQSSASAATNATTAEATWTLLAASVVYFCSLRGLAAPAA